MDDFRQLIDSFEDEMMSIPEFYAGQSIFITGGTGFMGKVLIEKFLRSCPGVERLYVLIRPKKNLSIEERWLNVISLPLFDRLKSEQPQALQKITLVPGSIEEHDLGLSDVHKQMLVDNVSIIYHVAAMVQFNNCLSLALLQNVRGTMFVAEVAKTLKKLQGFVHVSTAYCNYDRGPTKSFEEVIPSYHDWKVLLKMVEKNPVEIEILKNRLLCGHPNPYTWSKSLAEQVINDYRNDFPVIIMRPALVWGAVNDPVPGWVDAVNAFNAICIGSGIGVIKVLKVNKYGRTDIIPVDYAIKAFIIAPWKRYLSLNQGDKNVEDNVEVYNCSISKNTKITYYDIEIFCGKTMDMYPSVYQVWKRAPVYIIDQQLFFIAFFLMQVLPAAIADLVLLTLRKPRIGLKLTRKLQEGYSLLGNVTKQMENFPNQGFVDLTKKLKEEDVADFYYNVYIENVEKLLHEQTYGLRKYVFKEDFSEKTLVKTRKRLKIINVIHKMVKLAWHFSIAWLITKCMNRVFYTRNNC